MIPIEMRHFIGSELLELIDQASKPAPELTPENAPQYVMDTHTSLLTLSAAGVLAKSAIEEKIWSVQEGSCDVGNAETTFYAFSIWQLQHTLANSEVQRRIRAFESFIGGDQLSEAAKGIFASQHQESLKVNRVVQTLIQELDLFREGFRLAIDVKKLPTDESLSTLSQMSRELRYDGDMGRLKEGFIKLPARDRRKMYQSVASVHGRKDLNDPQKGDAAWGKEHLFDRTQVSRRQVHSAIAAAASGYMREKS